MNEKYENKEMKTSGIRPPTKIPTKGVSRLPSSSSIKLDGVHSTVTKLDGGSTAKKNADMPYISKHNGFNKKPTDERKSSSSSESYMSDARRLSEAGVRRSSGNSVVLTEDTDKFIIGNRVWVGGTKPGQIAYIGETNFGNGDWAGVVLDEPIGKNDGSVSGTRYFQCEPKKGIFARLTNLTSAPLGSIEDTMVQNSFSTAKPLGFSTPMPKRQASTVSAVKPIAKSVSQQSVSKSSYDLKIGDRVIISSGQGSKLGVLRYRGSTQFAPGEWCGIELDDPLGKNDGSVEGIKYFECEDKFGLFTPIAKVSKSPMSSSRIAGNCAIHKTKRSPGSMNGSMISAVTSNTMSSIPTRQQTKVSELDRLKLQLTQTKNENELLRSQVTKAANQADTAEKKLGEVLKAQSDMPPEIQSGSLIALQNQLENMKKQMDEEKEKIQNLQFTNEEQNVVNIELKNKNSELLIKIKELEMDLDKERNLAKDVETETMKIFEKEEELCRVKEELESLKKLIDNNEDELQKSVSNLSSEVVDKEALLNTLRQTLNENSQIHDRLLKEANEKLLTTTERLNKVIEEKDKKIEQSQEMIDQLNEGIKCLSALKNDEHDDIVSNLKNELSKLKDEYKVIIDEKNNDAKIVTQNYVKIENELKEELKNVLEKKNQEIEELQKQNNDIMSKYSSERNNVNELKQKLQINTKKIQDMKAKYLVYVKEALKVALEQQIESISFKIEDLKNQFETSLLLKNKQIETCNRSLKQIQKQFISSKSQLEISFDTKIKEKDDQINILTEKLSNITNDNEVLEIANKNINIKMNKTLKLVEDKTNIIADLEKKYYDLESQQDLSRNELEKELTTKLKNVNDELASLKLEKSTLEEKHENYLQEAANTIKDMENKLKENIILVENQSKSFNELIVSKQKELDNVNKKIMNMEEEREQILKKQISELATKDELITKLNNKLEKLLSDKEKEDLSNANLQIELTTKITKYEDTIKELQNVINELEVKIASDDEKLKKEIELSNNEKETLKSENLNLSEKLKSLETLKLNLEERLKSSELCKQDIQLLNETLKEKEKMIDEYQIKIKYLDDSIEQTRKEYDIKLQKKEVEIKELLKIGEDKMEVEKLSLEEKTKFILNEKDKEITILQEHIKNFDDIKIILEKQLLTNETQKQDIKKLNEIIDEKMRTIDDNNKKIEHLNNSVIVSKNTFEVKMQEKEDEIVNLLKAEGEKLEAEKMSIEQTKIMLNEKNEENSSLIEKLKILENTKVNLEQQLLQIQKNYENSIIELKKAIDEKSTIVDDNNSIIEQLNTTIILSKREFDIKLKDKEDKIEELMKIEEKLESKQLVLENSQLNLDKELEIKKMQEDDIIKLKNTVEEKIKIIDDNNLKIEQLNSLIIQIKEDFDLKLKEKEKKLNELEKTGEEKLVSEKMKFEANIKMYLEEKDNEIKELKTQLNELIKNDTEKELILKLESVVNDLEKEKAQVSSLEELKIELEKKVSEHKTEIELLEVSKNNLKTDMTKAIEEQNNLNAKHVTKIESEFEILTNEKFQIQKQIDELKTEYSAVQNVLHEKNCEIEQLKIQLSQKPKISNSDNTELDQLKVLLEKDRSTRSYLEFRIQELTDENHRLNERIESNSNQLKENYNVIQDKHNMEKKYEEIYSMLKLKENQILVLQTELNSWKLKDMEKSKNNTQEKTETHLLVEKNEEIKMLNSIILSLHKKLSAVMETDVSEFEIEKNPNGVSKEDYQKLYKTAKNNTKLKECENMSLKQEISKLKTENERFSEYKIKCDDLEKDKKMLQKLVVTYESSQGDNVKNEKNDSKSETEKILDEKDWQINLLNNIIAGLHAKVSDNKFKIEALEKQIMDSGLDQNKKVRLRTARLYCEHCEIFDSHDTEDCPEKPESPKFQKKRKEIKKNEMEEEPFCVCCDMFGHTANDCDSSLTF